MLHTKFHGNQSTGTGEDFLKSFYHIWAWRPSWSCDPDAVHKLVPPTPRRLNTKFRFDWPSDLGEEERSWTMDGRRTMGIL